MYPSTRADREQWIREARYNLFNLRSGHVFIDLLTDSGTGAMSDLQWSAMMSGDESYAGVFILWLKDAITRLLGFAYFLPTHQGRAAENVLFSVLIGEGDVVPGNAHFDTTKGHIEFRKATAVDCTIKEAYDTTVYHPFKGNIDLEKLENRPGVWKGTNSHDHRDGDLQYYGRTAGFDGKSKAVREFANRVEVLVIFDGARFAENAYFIKMREPGYHNHSIRDIVREMLCYADAMTMSSKKDAIVNMGGFIALKRKSFPAGQCL